MPKDRVVEHRDNCVRGGGRGRGRGNRGWRTDSWSCHSTKKKKILFLFFLFTSLYCLRGKGGLTWLDLILDRALLPGPNIKCQKNDANLRSCIVHSMSGCGLHYNVKIAFHVRVMSFWKYNLNREVGHLPHALSGCFLFLFIYLRAIISFVKISPPSATRY